VNKVILIVIGLLIFNSCKKEPKELIENQIIEEEKPKIIEEFGYVLNNYKVIKDTIKNGESFGEI